MGYGFDRIVLFMVIAATAVALSGCGGGGDDGEEPAPANRPPVVDAGPALSVDAGELVVLSGSAGDPDGSIAAYRWEQTGGAAVALTGADSPSARFTAPDVAADETLSFRLTVTDNEGLQASDAVEVAVRRVNKPPMVDAGPGQSVDAGEAVLLSGSAGDPDGSIAAYLWEQTGGATAMLTGADSPSAMFTAPDVAADETLSFRLTVTDNEGLRASDAVEVAVRRVNKPPMVDAGPGQSVDAGELVVLSGSAGDPDGSIAAYLWEQTGGATAMLTGAAGPSARFTAPDVPADETLSFRLTVTDNEGLQASDAVDVAVRRVNKPPMVDAGPDRSVDAREVVFLSGSAGDPDGSIAAYLWEQTGGTAVSLSGADSLNLSFIAPDVAADETLSFRLTVTDNEGLQASDAVEVAVRRVNKPPMVDAGPDRSVDGRELVVLSGSASDPDGSIAAYLWEQTGGTGVSLSGADSPNLSFIAPDVAVDQTLSFRLTVTDNDGAPATDTVSVTVKALLGDFFHSSRLISGEAGRSEGSNIGASLEDGEPMHAGNSGGASVWWTWTAPQAGGYVFDTHGSNFDTLLAVYSGDSLDRLVEVASSDDADGGTQSVVRFRAQQGHVYHIAVDGFGGATGAVVLSWRMPSVLPSAPGSVTQFADNVVVIGTPGSLTTDPLDFPELVRTFYGKYDDAFDFLIFVSNLPDVRLNEALTYYGVNSLFRNDVEGIGLSLGAFRHIESVERLKSVVHLSFYDGLERGPALHEIMHTWANYAVPTTVSGHWGFSSANGQLGGFDLANLVEHSPGKYSAGRFGTLANGGNSVPYSPIELYLAGFIPASEVPDLWVAHDGAWTDETDASGNQIFTASDIETYSIEQIVADNGVRDPDFRASQKHFRAALILLVDDMFPVTTEALEALSVSVEAFSRSGSDGVDYLFNFWEATGGRATLVMDGLAQNPAGAASLPLANVADTTMDFDMHEHDVDAGIDGSADHHWMTPPDTHGVVGLGY